MWVVKLIKEDLSIVFWLKTAAKVLCNNGKIYISIIHYKIILKIIIITINNNTGFYYSKLFCILMYLHVLCSVQ